MQKESVSVPPYNPHMFTWARQEAGLPIEKVKKKYPRIESWEEGDAIPTVKQARNLAKLYNRSFVEFFRESEPRIDRIELVSDFRLYQGSPDPTNHKYFEDIQTWVEGTRLNALDLFEVLGEKFPQFPETLSSSIRKNPEEAAQVARHEIGFTIDEQFGLRQSDIADLPSILRHKLEAIGVLVLKKSSLHTFNARGFCIAEFPLPVIVFGNEAPTAQAFTLCHEFGHLILHESGIIGPIERYGSRSREALIERWCNQFASALLIPIDMLSSIFSIPDEPYQGIDDATIEDLAKTFRVSPHAMLIRLIEKGYVEKDFYWQHKKAEFDKEEKEYKSFGRAKYYGTRYKNSLGNLYTGLVIQAWQNGKMTNHNAAEFMGIKNLTHLYDIKNDYLGK